MAFITWSDDLSVGHEEIDRQHRELVRLINELHDAMRAGKGRDAVGGIVAGLYDYTLTHFGYEEGAFTRAGYPATESHRAEHAAFVDKVAAFKGDFASGKMGLSVDVLDFLWKWLKDHIMGKDRKVGEFLAGRQE
jgi:hemerythrin-like metal-binding protein